MSECVVSQYYAKVLPITRRKPMYLSDNYECSGAGMMSNSRNSAKKDLLT